MTGSDRSLSKGTLTPQQIAEFLQVEPQTVWRMIRRGDLPAIKIGRIYRVTLSDFESWLEKEKRAK
jgi:excisionase family DNA binding protein